MAEHTQAVCCVLAPTQLWANTGLSPASSKTCVWPTAPCPRDWLFGSYGLPTLCCPPLPAPTLTVPSPWLSPRHMANLAKKAEPRPVEGQGDQHPWERPGMSADLEQWPGCIQGEATWAQGGALAPSLACALEPRSSKEGLGVGEGTGRENICS